MQPEEPILLFKGPSEWESWLAANHQQPGGVWLQFYKKASAKTSVTYAEALDWALCYGWIDTQVKKYDDESYLQKFTPRRPGGTWSKINIGHVARLTEAGLMKPAGLKQVEAAKADGRWEQAYDSASKMETPADFLKELSKNKAAQKQFESLNKSNVYAINFRLQTAKKPETRAKRMQNIITMLAEGKSFH